MGGFYNVLYEIGNETHPSSTEWQYHMIRFIHEYENGSKQTLRAPFSGPAVVHLRKQGGATQ